MYSKLAALTVLFLLLVGCAPASSAPSGDATQAPPEPSHTATVSPAAVPSPSPEPEPEPYDYTIPVPERDPVEDDWFSDAVIIGDSRTDGLHKFSGLKAPTYLFYTGLTVFDFSTRAVIVSDGDNLTAHDALGRLSPAKIYLCLGLNELGWHDDNAYYEEYGKVVDAVRALHPGAQIYLQLLIPVNAAKCKANNQPAYVTNEQIAVYNEVIRQVAAEREVYLIDLPEVFADEQGELPREMTGDGVHMTRAGYAQWADYLRTHIVMQEETNP